MGLLENFVGGHCTACPCPCSSACSNRYLLCTKLSPDGLHGDSFGKNPKSSGKAVWGLSWASEGRSAIDVYVLSFSERGKMLWDSPFLSGPVGLCTAEQPSQATSYWASHHSARHRDAEQRLFSFNRGGWWSVLLVILSVQPWDATCPGRRTPSRDGQKDEHVQVLHSSRMWKNSSVVQMYVSIHMEGECACFLVSVKNCWTVCFPLGGNYTIKFCDTTSVLNL